LLFYISRINFRPRLCSKRAGTKALCWTFFCKWGEVFHLQPADERSHMLDLLMIAMAAGFFMIALAYVAACDNL
jgi:hypothetical protein